MMWTRRRRTADVFYEAESPSVPPAASHIPDIPHPISNLPRFVKFLGPAHPSDRFCSPKHLFPGVRPPIASATLDD